jgi:transposase
MKGCLPGPSELSVRLLRNVGPAEGVAGFDVVRCSPGSTQSVRGGDTVHEQLFFFGRLEDPIPANHPLRVIRTWVNAALVEMNDMLDQMYAVDTRAVGRASPPRSACGQCCGRVLHSVRSERQLMEQVRSNMAFRWFFGLAMDDRVWDPLPKAST